MTMFENEGDLFEKETAKEALGGTEVSPEAEHKAAQMSGEMMEGYRGDGR